MKKAIVISSSILSSGFIIGCAILTVGISIALKSPGNVGYTNPPVSNEKIIQTEQKAPILSNDEKHTLILGYTEEMVARDAYNYFYSLYGVPVFKEIANSEQHHMNAVKTLLDTYELPAPTKYGELQSTFDTMKATGEKGTKEGLEVGLQIEMLDIKNISGFVRNTNRDDFKATFLSIGAGSYYHIREFSKALAAERYTTNVDVSAYLSAAEINSRNSLRYKLVNSLK